MELIRQVDINIDYILMLVEKYHAKNCEDQEILASIDRAIDSSIQLRSKKELIHGFINTMNAATVVERDWHTFVAQQKRKTWARLFRRRSSSQKKPSASLTTLSEMEP